jgi:hypothetical protein
MREPRNLTTLRALSFTGIALPLPFYTNLIATTSSLNLQIETVLCDNSFKLASLKSGTRRVKQRVLGNLNACKEAIQKSTCNDITGFVKDP